MSAAEGPDREPVAPRRWWLALILALLGAFVLAYLYAGRPWRAVLAGVAWLVVVVAMVHGLWGLTIEMILPVYALFVAIFVVTAIEAPILAYRARTYHLRPFNRWYFYLGAFVFPLVVAAMPGAFGAAVMIYRVPSESNLPTLLVGDYMAADMRAYAAAAPERGDLIIFENAKGIPYVKRVIGLPGETIALKRGIVSIDGLPVSRELLSSEPDPAGGPPIERYRETLPNGRVHDTQQQGQSMSADYMDARRVAPDSYFVLGDDRDNSLDSRYSEALGGGDVPRARVQGKVRRIVWSDRLARIGISPK